MWWGGADSTSRQLLRPVDDLADLVHRLAVAGLDTSTVQHTCVRVSSLTVSGVQSRWLESVTILALMLACCTSATTQHPWLAGDDSHSGE